MITPYLPYPLLSGGQIRSYNLIRELSKKHQITLFSFIRSKDEQRYLPELLKYCQKVKVWKRRRAFSLFNLVLAGVSFYPFLMSIYWDPLTKRQIREELESGNYDLVHAETFYVMHNLPSTSLPIVLAEQNIEYQVYLRFSQRAKFFLRPFLYFDVAKIKFWEKYFWKKVKRVIVASTLDKEIIEKEIKTEVGLVPNGVDLDFFADLKRETRDFPTILFVGSFKWIQNRDAVSFSIKEIWPKIKEKVPKVKFLIVGRDAPPKLREAILDSGAILKEDVLEIKDVYQIADVLLAPIRIGGGTKFKILEAMAAGIPVVTTEEGIEGLKIKDGQEVLVGEKTEDLTNKVVEVLKNESLRNNLIKKAKAQVSENYNWQKIAKDLDRVWLEVAR